MRKIAIIGAGVSGLSVAQMLKDKHAVVIYEADERPGGMIKCDRIEGNLFHRTGGHVFNTKRQDVMDWFWNHFDKEQEFTKAIRNSAVHLSDKTIVKSGFVPYPIENHSYLLEASIQENIIADWLNIVRSGENKYDNFEDFLRNRFGDTLYKLYFEPYNKKVWRRSLTNVPLDWLEGKLPMPTVEEMFFNNMNHVEERQFVHSSFYYPKNGGSQFIANRLAEGLDIRYNSDVRNLKYDGKKWIVCEESFDEVIFTGNIKQLPELMANQVDISTYTSYIEALESHGTTSVFCDIDANPYSWLYLPDENHHSHRIICTGNFSKTNNAEGRMTATIEFTDYISKEEILRELALIPLHPHYITHNFEKYTYPIQDRNTREMISSLNKHLSTKNFHLLGRFAQWEYANMDVCMGMAMALISGIK